MNKKAIGFIRPTKRGPFSLGAESDTVPYHAVRRMTTFCETVHLDYKKVMALIRNVSMDGGQSCTYGGWTFSWMYESEWHSFLREHGVKNLGPEWDDGSYHLPKYPEDAPKRLSKFLEQYKAYPNF